MAPNNSRRLLMAVLLLYTAFALTACGGNDGGAQTADNPPTGIPADTSATQLETATPLEPATPALQSSQPAAFRLAPDTYAWLGNSRITVPADNGLLSNDVGVSAIVSFQGTSAKGGTVSGDVFVGGGFAYDPPPPSADGVPFTGTDTFTYTAKAPDGRLAQGTVNITIGQMAWYVKNNFAPAAGQTPRGNSTAPFTSLADAAAVSKPGDIIFVFTGDGTPTGQREGITLKPNQRLVGQGVGLMFDVLPDVHNNVLLPITGVASTAAAPNALPVISDTVTLIDNSPIVRLADGVEVSGVMIDGTGAKAGLNGISGVDIDGFSIHNNTIRSVQRSAILLGGVSSGIATIAGNSISNLNGPDSDNAVDIVTSATDAFFTILDNTLNIVSQSGIRVQFNGTGGGTVAIVNNSLANVATSAGRRGIDVDAAGTAKVTATISGNRVSNSGVARISRSGIQVSASSAGPHLFRVTGNVVNNANPGDGGIQAQTTAATVTLCLQMAGNTSDRGFLLDNRPAGTFQVEGLTLADFEVPNNPAPMGFTYLPTPDAITIVPIGTCSF